MLQKCTAFFLLLAFLASTFSRAVIIADFYANQDYIAKNLCENRDKPMLHCCGKCLLRKRLAREDNQDKNNPERKTDEKQEVIFHEQTNLAPAPVLTCTITAYATGPDVDPIDRTFDIFHPPA